MLAARGEQRLKEDLQGDAQDVQENLPLNDICNDRNQ